MSLRRVRIDGSTGRLLETEEPFLEGGVLRVRRHTYDARDRPFLESDRDATPKEVERHEREEALDAAAEAMADPAFVARLLAGEPAAQLTAMVATGRVELEVAKAAGWEPPADKMRPLPTEPPAGRVLRPDGRSEWMGKVSLPVRRTR